MSFAASFAQPFQRFRAPGWADAWIAAEQGQLVLFLPVFMGIGVIGYFAWPTEPGLFPWLLATLGLGAGAAVARGLGRLPLLALFCLALGVTACRVAAWRAPPWDALPRGAVVATGTIAVMESLPEGRRITLDGVTLDGGATLARRVRLRLRNTDALALNAGDRVAVRALLRPPPAPAYPGGWDMRRDAFFQRMGGFGFAIGPARLIRGAPMPGVERLRADIAARVMAALPGPRGAIAATLLTGLGGAIPPDDRRAFQNSGLAHLLAVAGLHIGIVMGLFFALVRFGLAASEHAALHWPIRRIAALVALLAGAAYLVLTGGHIPILRSFMMAALVVLGVLTGRRAISLRALALAAAALMLVAPEAVMGVSFQMSFSAVLALIAGYEALRPLRVRTEGTRGRRVARYVGGLALTSLLAGTASLPFAAYHFGTATLFYVPANLLAVPLMAFWVMPCCVSALFLMPFGAERLALIPAGWGIGGLRAIASGVAAWPDASLRVPQIPAGALLMIAAGLIWLGLWRSRLRLAGIPAMLVGAFWAALAPRPDLFVSADARVIAARLDGMVFVERARGAAGFARDAPGRIWGVLPVPFPAAGSAAGGRLRCTAAACDIGLAGLRARLVRDAAVADCAGAGIVLAAVPLDDACPGVPRIDRFTVLHGGAATVTANGGAASIVRADPPGRARPWTALPGTTPSLPAAATE